MVKKEYDIIFENYLVNQDYDLIFENYFTNHLFNQRSSYFKYHFVNLMTNGSELKD